MKNDIIKIFIRDLDKLKEEINLIHEENLWKITNNIKNSAGNLSLHLVGNLNTYIGKNLGKTGFIRDREKEFSEKNINKNELINLIENTKIMVESTLTFINEAELEKLYPENVLGYEMSTQYFLIHLLSHLSYHLGQINYLRRVLE